MAAYFDKRVAEQTRKTAAALRDTLALSGWRSRGPVESNETPGAYIVEAEAIDGLRVEVHVIGFPWANDGTWRDR